MPNGCARRTRQTVRGVAVSALAPRGADAQRLRAELATALRNGGLAAPEVIVDVVTDLPRDARTGKLRRFVPLV